MTFGLSVVGFIVAVCIAAGFLFASRIAKTGGQIAFLGILFGIVFLVALSGLTVAGCVVLYATAH
jgi:hypothetical protein